MFSAAYLDGVLAGVGEVGTQDLVATLTELTAVTVARALAAYDVTEVVASGGGTHNPALMDALRRRLGDVPLVTSDERGLPPDAKESVLWALLGWLSWHGLPGATSATGATVPRILGRFSPGAGLAPASLRPTDGREDTMTTHRLGVSAALVEGQLVAGDVAIDGELVEAVGLPPASGGRIAAPGLVDIQVNGFAGVDLMAADVDELHSLARALPRHGVTAWLPTLITAAVTDTDRALDRLGEAFPPGSHPVAGEARTLGVHLEGPYLSPRRLGTHPPQHRRDPDLAELDAWRRRGDVVAVTLAPELPHALELVKALSDDGVLVSLGHSDATAYDAHLAFDAGARTVTHLFNAMSAMRHREPGLPGAALSRQDVVVQMVLDGHHLSPDVVRVVWAAAPDRVVLVTDATAAAGRPDGTYALAGVALDVTDGVVRNPDGTLAGSALTLSGAVRNAVEIGIDPAAVLTAVTERPADLLGRDDIGRLRPGARADVTVFDDDLSLRETWLGGDPVELATP